MPKTVERIRVLEERLKQLKAKQQKSEARRRTLEGRQARRDETRRKILAGAVVLEKVERDARAKTQFREWLDESLTREEDRALFDLAPVSREAQPKRQPPGGDQRAGDAVGD